MIYMDYNATAPVHPEVLEVLLPFYGDRFGNPSSIHGAGRRARCTVEEARERVARLVNCSASEVVFTASGSEADNMAIKGAAAAFRHKGNHVIATTVEHPAVAKTCRWLESQGYEVSWLPVDGSGLPDPDRLEKLITGQTILITAMYANNETGTLLPIKELGTIAARHGICFHCDAVQAAGRVPIDCRDLNIQLLSLSGHKIGAPQGTGALIVRNGVKLMPLIHGGHQERNRRGGTENVAGIAAFGASCDLAGARLAIEAERMGRLRDRLEQGIISRIRGVAVNGDRDRRLPNTANLSFAGIVAESLLMALDLEGVAVSAGAACSSGTVRVSPVLAAMGVSPDLAKGAVRFSFGWGNSDEDVDRVLDLLPEIVERLRSSAFPQNLA